MEDTADERRRYARVEESLCAWLSFRRDGAAYGTQTMDVGPQGAQFSAWRAVRVCDRVSVHLQLPNGSIGCEGTVCWVKPADDGFFRFGVRFVDLPASERDYLERFLGGVLAA